MKKSFFIRLFALALALVLLVPAALPVKAAKDPIYDISLDSQGVYLQNLETGAVLYRKNEETRMYPASITKVMTALLVLESCSDPANATITVTDTAPFDPIIEEGGVHMELREGEILSVKDLLLGMLMNSFCDAAQLLAFHFGGDNVDNFVKKMNERAAELGMENTHFANPHGLHDPEHWSCPRDLARLMAAAVEDPRFVELIRTRVGVIPATEFHSERLLTYTVDIFYPGNEYYLDAFVGGKSGFTDEAGRCLASYSVKDGASYVCVMMGANQDGSKKYGKTNMAFLETSTLLSYVLENFSLQPLLKKGEQVTEIPVIDSETSVPVVVGEDLILLARNGAEAEYRLDLPDEISSTEVENGAVVGRVTLLFNDGEGEKGCPLVLKWDETPIHTKSVIQKEGEKVVQSITRIFSEDKNFVILVVLLIIVIAVSVPVIKLTQYLKKRKMHPPKH